MDIEALEKEAQKAGMSDTDVDFLKDVYKKHVENNGGELPKQVFCCQASNENNQEEGE